MAYRSLFPEEFNYPDLGCEFSPRCVDCPLERCRYDMSASMVKHMKVLQRWDEIESLVNQGISIPRVAIQVGISPRTIYRIKSEKSCGKA